ncbi:MAG: hypothetical protein ACE5KA_02235 [Nitrososphaerales archaeon]
MESNIPIAGSTVGAHTTMAVEKVSKGDAYLMNNPTTPSIDLQRRIVAQAMNRVYDYESQGKLTFKEREKLVAKYRQELNALDNRTHAITLYNIKEISALKENLAAVLDQRMAQINSKLDDLVTKIGETPVQGKPAAYAEKKVEKWVETNHLEHVANAESAESAEGDANLDEIKKQIMQTLSRLEQAEVE